MANDLQIPKAAQMQNEFEGALCLCFSVTQQQLGENGGEGWRGHGVQYGSCDAVDPALKV